MSDSPNSSENVSGPPTPSPTPITGPFLVVDQNMSRSASANDMASRSRAASSLEEGIVEGITLLNYRHVRKDKTTRLHKEDEKVAEKYKHDFEYADWGAVYDGAIEKADDDEPKVKTKKPLGQWRATSIAGNDLLASVLYTVGITTTVSGPYAWISLLLICVFLYPYRMIYGEVGMALPLNGGSYNCLINATSKFVATIAACLSLLSYTATAVVSAASATAYVDGELGSLPVFWVTIGILFVFAMVTVLGVRDSSLVAITIFIIHGCTLVALVVASFVYLIEDKGQQFVQNWQYSVPNPPQAIYYGFCAGLLGITGFETSSNYIEEQAPGVFPKTMNNMWWLVLFFNPTIGFLSLAVLPIETFIESPNNILSIVGGIAAGRWFRILIAVDAAIVLCGGVLTAFIGVVGLIERMASDRCLPAFLAQKNRFFKTAHWTIATFFILTSTLYAIVDGDLTSLAGVFAGHFDYRVSLIIVVAFLGVMCMFAFGNLILKYKRPRLPRPIRAHWALVLLGLGAMFSGLVGNIVINPDILKYFAIYFCVPMVLVIMFLNQVRIVKMILFLVERTPIGPKASPVLKSVIRKMKELTVVFFTKTDEIHILNKAVLYAHNNEHIDRIKIIHLYENEESIPRHLVENHYILDHLYPKIQIDLHLIKGTFSPEIIPQLSSQFKVPANFMFVRCPGDEFKHKIGQFKGVRMIMA